mgnify:FL=1|jgi:hypothetical protein|tara:strand:+ start:269 stop:1360 length:1092 start_codon:yes stop_codon:yes gene_type:complete
MARDYTKYTAEGLGENLNKRKLVFTIVKDWAEKNNPSLEEIQTAFPDEVQGGKGFIVKESEVKDAKRFNMKEPLSIKNGVQIVMSNQWGENIADFITGAEKLGYTILKNTSNNPQDQQNSVDVNADTSLEEIDQIIEEIIHGDLTTQENFRKNTINFINENNQYYWFLLAINNALQAWENKIDDEGLDLSVDGLHLKGGELNFNPYEEYRLFYNWREEKFGVEEDDDEPTSFFKALIDSFYDFDSHSDLISLGENDLNKFINMSKTVLLCTVCKECENDTDTDDLTNLLLGINFEDLPEINDKLNGGDISNEILEDVLETLDISVEDYKNEEELWKDLYLLNYEDVAREILDNDVFDKDYIRS